MTFMYTGVAREIMNIWRIPVHEIRDLVPWSSNCQHFYRCLPQFREVGDYLYEKSVGTFHARISYRPDYSSVSMFCYMGVLEKPFVKEYILPYIQKIRRYALGRTMFSPRMRLTDAQSELCLEIPFNKLEIAIFKEWGLRQGGTLNEHRVGTGTGHGVSRER